MSKMYLGSSKLHCNFKMFRVRFNHSSESQRIKSEVMQLMNDYLHKYDGKLINVKQLTGHNQLMVYFVTGEEQVHQNWQNYLKGQLLKGYDVVTSGIELGPRVL